jgi:hypothetical protein
MAYRYGFKSEVFGPRHHHLDCLIAAQILIGSYRIAAGTCVRSGWNDPEQNSPPQHLESSAEDLAHTPCPSSTEISTFMSRYQFLSMTTRMIRFFSIGFR